MVRFETKGHPDVLMFDGVAGKMLTLMGHSGSIPGAFDEDEVAQALANLQAAVLQPSAQSGDDWGADSVSLAHRAQPLIDLFTKAKNDHNHVIWEKSLR